MKAGELRDLLHELTYTCTMNQLYHQHVEHKWWRWDKAVKIVVGLLAVIALVAVYLPEEQKHWVEVPAGWLAALAAIILNVVPVGEWEAHSAELFRAWTDLGTRARLLTLKIASYGEDQDVDTIYFEWFTTLATDRQRLNAQEPAPDEKLLRECQADVNEMTYGEGIRTAKQVEEHLAARQGHATPRQQEQHATAGTQHG